MKKGTSSLLWLLGGFGTLAAIAVAARTNEKKTPSKNDSVGSRYVDRVRLPRSQWTLQATYKGILYQLDPPESVPEGTPPEARTLRSGDRLVGYLDGDRWTFTKQGYEGLAWFEFPNGDQLADLTNLGPPIGSQ